MIFLKSKKGILILAGAAVLLLATVALLLYFFLGPKTYVVGNERVGLMHLTLPRGFEVTEQDGHHKTVLENEEVKLTVYQEDFGMIPPPAREKPLEWYAYELMHYAALLGEDALQKKGDLLFFEYEQKDYQTGEMTYSLVVVFQGPYDKGYLHFKTAAQNKEAYREEFLDWATSLEFTDDHWPPSWKEAD